MAWAFSGSRLGQGGLPALWRSSRRGSAAAAASAAPDGQTFSGLRPRRPAWRSAHGPWGRPGRAAAHGSLVQEAEGRRAPPGSAWANYAEHELGLVSLFSPAAAASQHKRCWRRGRKVAPACRSCRTTCHWLAVVVRRCSFLAAAACAGGTSFGLPGRRRLGLIAAWSVATPVESWPERPRWPQRTLRRRPDSPGCRRRRPGRPPQRRDLPGT